MSKRLLDPPPPVVMAMLKMLGFRVLGEGNHHFAKQIGNAYMRVLFNQRDITVMRGFGDDSDKRRFGHDGLAAIRYVRGLMEKADE